MLLVIGEKRILFPQASFWWTYGETYWAEASKWGQVGAGWWEAALLSAFLLLKPLLARPLTLPPIEKRGRKGSRLNALPLSIYWSLWQGTGVPAVVGESLSQPGQHSGGLLREM